MFKIGNIEIDGKVVLAPMAGFTFSSYRKFMKPFGVSLSFSEMVSDLGICYLNKETLTYTRFENEKGPIGLQLFGSDPKNFQKAIKILKSQGFLFDFIDVNMGCPVPKVTKTGAGSALMKSPKLCGDIIRAIKEEIDVPVTAKIRLGWDDNSINFKEVIKELESAKVDAISIHGRTMKQLYTGKARYELLKDIRKEMNVPLIISGDIYTLDDAIKAIDITKADACMVARGGLGNPQLVRQIDTYYKTGERLSDSTIEEQAKYCLDLAKLIVQEKGEDSGIKIFRSIGPKFFIGYPNSKTIRQEIATKVLTYKELEESVNNFVSKISNTNI